MATFDEAKEQAAELFQQGADNEVQGTDSENNNAETEETNDNTDTGSTEQPTIPEEQAAEAANIAETAANTAANMNNDIQALQGQIQQQNEVIQHLQQTISEQNEVQEEEIEQSIMPDLDIDRLTFEDEDTRREIMDDYNNKLKTAIMSSVMKEMEPAIKMAEEAKKAREKNEVMAELSKIPDLEGIAGMVGQLDSIISRNPKMFSNLDTDEQYLAAYAMARGVNDINTPKKEPTAQEIVDMLNNNSDALALLEKQRAEALKDSQQVPAMSASSGNVALNIPDKPKTWEDARERVRSLFRS